MEKTKKESSGDIRSLKRVTYRKISKTNIPNEQLGKFKSRLVAFIDNWSYNGDMNQDVNQYGESELSVSPANAGQGGIERNIRGKLG